MRFVSFRSAGVEGLGVTSQDLGEIRGLLTTDERFPGDLASVLAASRLEEAGRVLAEGTVFDADAVTFLPPLANPGKIICVGLNYADHSAESGFKQPDYPTLFARFASSLVAHRAPMVVPRISDQLDWEGEVVAVIGRGGRHIAKSDALDHVVGYSIFNEGSVRDYQFKAPQWTVGKNFDGTGAFGPTFVTADEVPRGMKGCRLVTRLNGEVVQSASTDDMVFDIASLIAITSEAITLAPGDVFVTGTPAGVGLARKPPLYMKAGDRCEVEVDGLGVLSNPIVAES